MKMMIAGAWRWDIYQKACADALKSMDVSVVGFSWGDEFNSVLGRFEAHTLIPLFKIRRLRRMLVNSCRNNNPDFLLIWGCSWLDNATLLDIKMQGVKLISYHNDDPFGSRDKSIRYILHRNIWRNFKKNLSIYDYNFVYRNKNIVDYQRLGIRHVELLLSYFIPKRNFPTNSVKNQCFDGVFIGHYEDDERANFISCCREAGIKIELYGKLWDRCEGFGNQFKNIRPLLGSDYNEKISEAKFALCFFSKINSDDYTRRVFEIPAAGTVLVAPRTKMMESLFKDGDEAILFDSIEHGIDRIRHLLENPNELERIAGNGLVRVQEYSVEKQMRHLVQKITSTN